MGVNYNPKIVTDGLVLCLDAANSRSYPKTGTTWTDLAGNNNASLVNTTTFDAANGGSIVFDGTNERFDVSYSVNVNDNLTIEGFIYPISNQGVSGGGGFILANGGYYLELATNYRIRSYFYNLSSQGYHYGNVTIPSDTWTQITVVRNKNDNNIKHYVNGEIDNTISNITGSVRNGIYSTRGGGYSGGSYLFQGHISLVKLYEKALTADEVRQNYNATKGRYE